LQWFVKRFDKDVVPDDCQPFASAADVGDDPKDNNALSKMCQSLRDTMHIPHHNTEGTTLYLIMRTQEDLYLQYHVGKGGNFCLCIGCANCSSRTEYYQPQNEVDHMGWNPDSCHGRQLKQLPVVQQAYRAFLSIILNDPTLAIKHHCRHLQEDEHPPAQPQRQLTWDAQPQDAPTTGPAVAATASWDVGNTFNTINGGGGGGGL
jgi:hypothetical protein